MLYRLAQMGCEAELASNPHADVVACSREGTRVALLRIRVNEGDGWSRHATDAASDARNRAHVFVDFGATEPACFVVPAVVVVAELHKSRSWPGRDTSALEAYRDAWHLLGLARKSASRSVSVVSPSSPSA